VSVSVLFVFVCVYVVSVLFSVLCVFVCACACVFMKVESIRRNIDRHAGR